MGHDGPSQEVLEEQQHKRGHQLYISLVEATQDCRSTKNGCNDMLGFLTLRSQLKVIHCLKRTKRSCIIRTQSANSHERMADCWRTIFQTLET
eukprot:scaffold1875_cov82-Cylindrotheca_fusiformis.AAC.1